MLSFRKIFFSLPIKSSYYFTTASATSGSSTKKKTYYQILQIPSSATLANIKQNYLRLAKIYHPDVYKGKDKERFHKIQQAYQVLSDRLKRTKYDEDIGVAVKSDNSRQAAGSDFGADQQQTGKPKNTMDYGSSAKDSSIDIDEQFNKFFNQKTKTQFEQIRVTQQAQIREMSEAQRLRRHFRNIYQSQSALNKSQTQKQFNSILNDQINQQNRMHEQNVQKENHYKYLNTDKTKRKYRIIIFIGFTLFCIMSAPTLYSYTTKYRLQKQIKDKYIQKMTKEQEKLQEIDLRFRFRYEQ